VSNRGGYEIPSSWRKRKEGCKKMRIVKILSLGALSGLLYAFVSFYLITPYLRDNLAAIGFFGLQGFLFSLAYMCAMSVTAKCFQKEKVSHKLRLNIAIGGISGVFSGSFNIAVTYYSAIVSFTGTVTSELHKTIISELVHYLFGCILIGCAIGILVATAARARP
jgi:hypothetical protein